MPTETVSGMPVVTLDINWRIRSSRVFIPAFVSHGSMSHLEGWRITRKTKFKKR